MRYLIFFSFFITFSLAAGPATVTLEEQEFNKQVEALRKAGFADIEIDNLHGSIGESLGKIKAFVDKGIDKKHARYINDLPETVPDVFSKDSEGKLYLDLELLRGESFMDYPKTYLYQSRVYIYPAVDGKNIDKIILQFKRTNSKGEVFIREMRRLINPSPKSLSKTGTTDKPDDNSDISLEYFTSNEGSGLWPDEPVQKEQASLVNKLNDPENLLPIQKQKSIIEKYKVIVRSIDKAVKKKLYLLELDRKVMVSKMLEFY